MVVSQDALAPWATGASEPPPIVIAHTNICLSYWCRGGIITIKGRLSNAKVESDTAD